MPVTVTMTSDFICPWCLIGEKRLFLAIDSLPQGIDVKVEWLPFELNPDMPTEGMDRKVYRSLKFGSWERSLALDAHTVAAGKADGIAFDYDRICRTPNTFAAHRVSWLAAREGRQRAVVEGLLNGYFNQGRDIGDPAVLVEIAGEAGMYRESVRRFLDEEQGAGAVRALEASSRDTGIEGVPHFSIEGTIVTGAQRPKILRQAIIDAHERAAGELAFSGEKSHEPA